jgi:hypothetical protein
MSESNNNNRVLDENVVLFPASKNFPLEPKKKVESVDLHDDPLEALLREFDDVSDLAFDDDLEIELEEIAREQMNLHVNNTDLRALAQLEKDELAETIDKQMKVLSETQARISYLLREIESYMPGRK